MGYNAPIEGAKMSDPIHIVDGGYITWLYGANSWALRSWPPASIINSIIMLDSFGKNVREQANPEYKANRKDKRFDDPELYNRWRQIRQFRQALAEDPRITIAQIEGLEADDLIALAVWKFCEPHKPINVMGVDKDLLQIGNGLRLISKDGERVTMERFQARLPKALQVHPIGRRQIPLILALMGDRSDNVPRLIQRGDLWRMARILWEYTEPVKVAYDVYGDRFIQNLYEVVLPHPSLFGMTPIDVYNAFLDKSWGARLLKDLGQEYEEEMETWKLKNLLSLKR